MPDTATRPRQHLKPSAAGDTLTLTLSQREREKERNLAAFVILLLLGFFFRIHRLPEVPSGLTWDEGAEGLETVPLFHGQFPLFFPEHGGHEPLLIYLQAAALKLLGWSAFSLRLPMAFLTTVALAATFLVARKLFGWRVAWLATLLQAVVLWQVVLSRIAIRPAALVLFGSLAVYWLVRWLRRQDTWRSAALCGLFTGLATYAYTPGRFLIILVALAWIAAVVSSPKRKPFLRQGALAGGVAALVFAPLGWYFVAHPGTFSERANELSIFNPAFGPPLLSWLNSLKAALLMFSFAGEPGWDKNIAHQAMFDPLTSILFVAGLGLALRRWRRPSYLLALSWLAIMSLPLTLTAKDLPDFGRVSGIAPAVFLFPALAAAALWRRWPATAWLLGVGGLVLTGVSYRQYFGVWEHASGKAESYRPGILAAGQSAIGRLPASDAPARLYFGVRDAHDAVTDFLIAGLGVEHPELAPRLIGYHAEDTLIEPSADAESYLIVPDRPTVPAPLGPLSTPASVTLGELVRLDSYDQLAQRQPPGARWGFRFYWQPERRFAGSVTFFGHVLDYAQRQVIASIDDNSFPASQWRGGERVLSALPLGTPENTPAGAYWLEFGAYADGGQRLRTSQGEDRLLLGPIVVAPEDGTTEAPVAKLGGVGLLPPVIRLAGDGLDVVLRWLPTQRLDRDYSVFVHVLDSGGKLVAQADGPPAGGRWPATYWLPNVPVDDSRHVPLPTGLPAGSYRISAGLYRLDSGERLPVTPAGPESGSVLVGEVTLG